MKEYWNNFYKSKKIEIDKNDNWLDKYKEILEKSHNIIDLGCGLGTDTFYLNKKGYNVLSCDFSEEALIIIKKKYQI